MNGEEPNTGTGSGMPIFPHDIVFDILSRLPLKSVLQFSCVSKSWLRIVKDPAFGKLHLTRSESDPTLLLLTRHVIGEKTISISPLKLNGLVLHANQSAITHMISPHSWNLAGTCDGLFCFTSFGCKELIMVCNPVTREHITLPEPTITPSPESCTPIIGFGFDHLKKKYKVVRIWYLKTFGGQVIGRETHVTAEVYTLGDTGSWREVPGFDYPPHGRPVYANRALYWLIHPKLHRFSEKIVSFDLGRDEFRLASHLKPNLNLGNQVSLVEIGGYLAVVDISSLILAEVSVMKDPSNNLWEMDYMIPVHRPHGIDMKLPRLVCVHEHDGVLVIWLQDSLMSYERRSFRLRDLRISEFPTWLDWEICSGYRGSLIRLSGFNTNADGIHFVSDTEFYSRSTKGVVDSEQENIGRCDKMVACFQKNGLLLPS